MRDPRLLNDQQLSFVAALRGLHPLDPVCTILMRDHIAAQFEIIATALKEAGGIRHDQNCPAGWVNVPLPRACIPSCVRSRLIAILKGEK